MACGWAHIVARPRLVRLTRPVSTNRPDERGAAPTRSRKHQTRRTADVYGKYVQHKCRLRNTREASNAVRCACKRTNGADHAILKEALLHEGSLIRARRHPQTGRSGNTLRNVVVPQSRSYHTSTSVCQIRTLPAATCRKPKQCRRIRNTQTHVLPTDR